MPNPAATDTPTRLDDEAIEAVADTLRVLAEPTRIRLISELCANGPASASRLAAPLPVTRQAVSRQLCVLRSAGIVRRRREGTSVLYELRDFTAPWVVAQLAGAARSGA
jgi:ArsR family transcriptional regulator, arsenate/arsenite/antimonite-responsive transcriptional repressor